MAYSNTVNSIGLILDILGAVLVFKFGLSFHAVTHNRPESYDFWGRVGLGLLITGFLVQLISNFIPF